MNVLKFMVLNLRMCLHEKTFDQLWPAIYENHLKGKIMIAHNAKFDMNVLRATLRLL